MNFKKKNIWIGFVFLIFGLMTILSGGRSLFTESGIATRGNIVPLVLWFNFVAGFFYLIASVSIFKMKTCVKKLSTALAVSNTFVLAYLLNHIFQGQLYEHKTLIAMIFRTSFWILVALYFRKSNLFNRIECNC
jgi:hypothetical protein